MNLKFKIEQVEALIDYTKKLVAEAYPVREGFDDAGLILASQFGAGVYLMSSMKDHEWTSRLVFAEHCNPDADDFDDEIAVAAYGTEETAELIPLDKVDACVAAARDVGREYLNPKRKRVPKRATTTYRDGVYLSNPSHVMLILNRKVADD